MHRFNPLPPPRQAVCSHTVARAMEKLQNGQMIEWQDLDKRRYYVIGPSLFMFVRAFIYPFNLIKTRLFMQEKRTVYSGTFDAFRKVIKLEGVRGLYKGFVVSSLGLVSGQLYITMYELIRSRLTGYSTEVKGLLAGAGATFVGQTVTVPVDIVSQHMMMQGQVAKKAKKPVGYIVVKNVDYIIPRKEGGASLKGAVSVARRIVRAEGVAGLYRGYGVSLVTYAPNRCVGLNESLLKTLLCPKHVSLHLTFSGECPNVFICSYCTCSSGHATMATLWVTLPCPVQ